MDNKIVMDIELISEYLYFYTNGYPYLVSRLCQIIDTTMDVDGVNFLMMERRFNLKI